MTELRGDITEEDLHAYVDGALDAERRYKVAAFLASAPAEAARVEAFRAQKAGIQALFDGVAREPAPQRLKRAMLKRGSVRVLRRLAPMIAAGGIAGLLLLAGSALGQRVPWLHSGVAAPAAAPAPVLPPPAHPPKHAPRS
ncbi:MAG TPA: hypothetical protein VE397_13750 [Stellaceae bacterium]|nr:hypothetical protein [Stellaceae bacterium]